MVNPQAATGQPQVIQQPIQLQMGGQTITQAATSDAAQAPQIIQVQGNATAAVQQPATQQQPTQVIHQIVTPSGEVQNVPVSSTR